MKNIFAVLVTALMILGGLSMAQPTMAAENVPEKGGGKITICHNTGSTTNPVVQIEVSVNAQNAHQNHQEGDHFIPEEGFNCDGTPIEHETVPQVGVSYNAPSVTCDTADLRGVLFVPEQPAGVVQVGHSSGMSEAGWVTTFSTTPPNIFENGESTITVVTPYFGAVCEPVTPPVEEETTTPNPENPAVEQPEPEVPVVPETPVVDPQPEAPVVPETPVTEPEVESYPAPEVVVVDEQPVAETQTNTTVKEPVKRSEGLNIQSAAEQDLPDELAYTGVNVGMLVAALILLVLGVVAVVSARRK